MSFIAIQFSCKSLIEYCAKVRHRFDIMQHTHTYEFNNPEHINMFYRPFVVFYSVEQFYWFQFTLGIVKTQVVPTD
jgi:hypothetical protein